MNDIKILDCTLRDGGYVNNFKFGEKNITKIINKLSVANIDIIECGFLMSGKTDENCSLYPSVEAIEPHLIEKKADLMYVGMIAYGEISADEISPYNGKSIDGIRITFHENEIEEAFVLGKSLKEKGYQIFMQPVGTMTYTDAELIKLIDKINHLNPFAFYLVDTLGTMYKNDLLRMFYLIDHNLNDNIMIGFHSHNNLQLSFANAQELMAIQTKRQLIIDSSVFGMGRGAGNLCTELITEYINKNIKVKYDIMSLLEIVDEHLNQIFSVTPWGYSVPYYLAATSGCHPNYASYLLNKQTLSVKNISFILNQLSLEERHLFNRKKIHDLYQNFQKHEIDDGDTVEKLACLFEGKKVLVLAPGKTLLTEEQIIQQYITAENPYIVAINFMPKHHQVDCLFLSNPKRFHAFENLEHAEKTTQIITTSNLKSETGSKINYSSLIDVNREESDNSGMMCLRFLRRCGVKKVALAGFDGFTVHNEANYIEEELINRVEREALIRKNAAIIAQLQDLSETMQFDFITSSKYESDLSENM